MNRKDIIMILGAVAVAVGVGLGIFFSRSLSTGSWGLSFRQEGAPPQGSETPQALRRWDAWYLGDPGEKTICLTFDAGYENGSTEQILDVLQAHQVPAAFFLTGSYLERNPDLVRRMAREGHTVGNHTMHHPDMSEISDPEAFRRELEQVEALYRQITGEPMPKFYRPPQGIYSPENLRQAQALGYRTLFWSLAYVDWLEKDQPEPEEALKKLTARIHPGAVVLLHSTSRTNARILDTLLTQWEQLGYRFITPEQLTGC